MPLLAFSADEPPAFSFQNITDADGLAIAITGMVIVFVVLLLISLFLTALPKILESVNTVFPEPEPHPTASAAASDDEEVAAAIGIALHRHYGGQ